MPESQPGETRFSHEIRVCLVMYGGVSLAIYMNGAAREFFDLVRGRGIWGVLKHLADVDVVTDVVSGASAGGINGLFLSSALCGQKEFAPLARLWREEGDIERLLRPANQSDAPSLLRSEYMEERLARAFRGMAPIGDARAEIAPSRVRQLDCFLAVTNFHGHGRTVGDGRGRPIRLKRYAECVHLRHREGRRWRQPFAEPERKGLGPETLAKIARATSAFPFAFEPIGLSAADFADAGGLASPDHLSNGSSRKVWYVDGGVLDNKPFTAALPMIYRRQADRPVDRVLFFVEPHPAAASEEPERGEPSFLETSLASLSTLPSQESISEDLRGIDQHNLRVQTLQQIYEPLWRRDHERREVMPPTEEQGEIHRRSRVHFLVGAVVEQIGDGVAWHVAEPPREPAATNPYEVVFPAAWEDLATQPPPPEGATSGEDALRARLEAIFGPRDELRLLDVVRTRRTYYACLYALKRVEEGARRTPLSGSERREVHFLSRRIEMLLCLESALASALAELGRTRREEQPGEVVAISWRQVLSVWRSALHSDPALEALIRRPPEDELDIGDASPDVEAFSQRLRERGQGEGGRGALGSSLLETFEEVLWQSLARASGEEAAERLLRDAVHLDAWRFPALHLARVGELDRVEYHRISPRDSVGVGGSLPALSRWAGAPMEKVAGRTLAHFSGFLKRSWRANDIMWGRLDAATIVWDALVRRRKHRLDRGRVAGLLALPASESLSPEVRELLRAFAEERVGESELERGLLAQQQRAILEEELPRVVADALEDELALRRARAGPGGAARREAASRSEEAEEPESEEERRLSYRDAAATVLRELGESGTDPLLRSVARAAVADWLREHDSGAEAFLRDLYEVGGEPSELDPVQTAVRGLQAARVAANMLTAEIGRHAGERSAGREAPRGWLPRTSLFLLRRATAALTSLHLAARALHHGLFPSAWGIALGVALALVVIGLLFGPAGREWPLVYVPALFAAGLLSAPGLWLRTRRWLRWPLLLGWGGLVGALAWEDVRGAVGAWIAPPVVFLGVSALALGIVLLLQQTVAAVRLRGENRRLRREIGRLEARVARLLEP